MTNTDLSEVRFQAQQFSAYQQGGTPVGVRDRSLARTLCQKNSPVKRSKASSRAIRRAVAKEAKRQAKLNNTQSKGF